MRAGVPCLKGYVVRVIGGGGVVGGGAGGPRGTVLLLVQGGQLECRVAWSEELLGIVTSNK